MNDKKNLVTGVSDGVLYGKLSEIHMTKPMFIDFHQVIPNTQQYYGRYLKLLVNYIDDEILFDSNITLGEFVKNIKPEIEIIKLDT